MTQLDIQQRVVEMDDVPDAFAMFGRGRFQHPVAFLYLVGCAFPLSLENLFRLWTGFHSFSNVVRLTGVMPSRSQA